MAFRFGYLAKHFVRSSPNSKPLWCIFQDKMNRMQFQMKRCPRSPPLPNRQEWFEEVRRCHLGNCLFFHWDLNPVHNIGSRLFRFASFLDLRLDCKLKALCCIPPMAPSQDLLCAVQSMFYELKKSNQVKVSPNVNSCYFSIFLCLRSGETMPQPETISLIFGSLSSGSVCRQAGLIESENKMGWLTRIKAMSFCERECA